MRQGGGGGQRQMECGKERWGRRGGEAGPPQGWGMQAVCVGTAVACARSPLSGVMKPNPLVTLNLRVPHRDAGAVGTRKWGVGQGADGPPRSHESACVAAAPFRSQGRPPSAPLHRPTGLHGGGSHGADDGQACTTAGGGASQDCPGSCTRVDSAHPPRRSCSAGNHLMQLTLTRDSSSASSRTQGGDAAKHKNGHHKQLRGGTGGVVIMGSQLWTTVSCVLSAVCRSHRILQRDCTPAPFTTAASPCCFGSRHRAVGSLCAGLAQQDNLAAHPNTAPGAGASHRVPRPCLHRPRLPRPLRPPAAPASPAACRTRMRPLWC